MLDFLIVVGFAALLIKFAVPHVSDVFTFFFVLAGGWWISYFGTLHNFLALFGCGLEPNTLEGVAIFLIIGVSGIALYVDEKRKDKKYIRITSL